jgi:hypothetical protein
MARLPLVMKPFARGRRMESATCWLGFTGVVKSNPFYDICRSQQDVEIQGDWRKLMNEVRDSHWMMAYGHHLKPLAYAARKIGIDWAELP